MTTNRPYFRVIHQTVSAQIGGGLLLWLSLCGPVALHNHFCADWGRFSFGRQTHVFTDVFAPSLQDSTRPLAIHAVSRGWASHPQSSFMVATSLAMAVSEAARLHVVYAQCPPKVFRQDATHCPDCPSSSLHSKMTFSTLHL